MTCIIAGFYIIMLKKDVVEYFNNNGAIGIGTPLAERPSHTTSRTDRVISGSAAY